MLVSVEPWRTETYDRVEVEFLAVQLEHCGFTLSRSQANEFCQKFPQLRAGETCQTDDGDTLFVDLDKTTCASPFVILAMSFEATHVRWFCDIAMPAAAELYEKLSTHLLHRDGEVQFATG